MERVVRECDNPVHKKRFVELDVRKSRTGHVKSCLKMGGPSSKAKYYWMTDSEQVPWGKGEKNPFKGSEIETEIVCIQAVEARHLFVWLRTFCIMGQRVTFSGKDNLIGDP